MPVVKICPTCRHEFSRVPAQAHYVHCSRKCAWSLSKYITVDPTTGCWITNPTKNRYRQRRIGGRRQRQLHIILFEKARGPVPDGHILDHVCENTRCVNPSHLEPVLHAENVVKGQKVMLARTASHCRNGHPWTEENTYRPPNRNVRFCRSCTRAAVNKYDRGNRKLLKGKTA
jgi:hypothetical protein